VTVLIVGATGLLGHATAMALLKEGQRVRALVRQPVRDVARVNELQQAGAELMAGDLTDPASLERACKGVLRVFACAHSFLGRGRLRSAQVDHIGHSALIAAALSAGVPRFVYTSTLSARDDHPIDFFRTKAEIEAVLRESTIPFTILRPAAFMEHHVHQLNGKLVLDKGFTVIFGPGRKRRNFVSVHDVVPFALMALQGDNLLGRTLDIGGPDNLSNREVAACTRGVRTRAASSIRRRASRAWPRGCCGPFTTARRGCSTSPPRPTTTTGRRPSMPARCWPSFRAR
jgi:uncharacterized protein YbjT (DUF2867 family)